MPEPQLVPKKKKSCYVAVTWTDPEKPTTGFTEVLHYYEPGDCPNLTPTALRLEVAQSNGFPNKLVVIPMQGILYYTII